MSRILLCTCICLLLPTVVRAGDFQQERLDNWHQWRGPEATGVAVRGNPPVRWDSKTNVQWKVSIPGRGSSTPIVWGDRVFVLTAIDTGRVADPKDIPQPDPKFSDDKKTRAPSTYHQFVVLCLDRQTGKLRWQQTAAERVPHEGHHETHSYAAFSPITDGKFLYVSFGSQGVYCYDFDGRLQWQRQLGRMETRYGWGEGSSPALHNDTLVVNFDHEGDSFIVALDTRTGATKWRAERQEPTSWSTPLIVERQDRTQVIVSATNRIRSYDLATGKVLWECGGQTINVIPSPVLADDLVICLSGYRGSVGLAIPLSAQGDITGKAAWQHMRGTPYVPSPLVVNGRVYFTQVNNALLSCLEARTGRVIFERERLPGLTSLYSSPVAARDRIYLVDREGTTLVLKQGDKVEVLATNVLGEGVDASPVVVGKQLLLRGEKHLYCFASE